VTDATLEARPHPLLRLGLAAAPLALALIFTSLILALSGAPPLETFQKLVTGSLGTAVKRADVTVVWVSLALASAGLLVTFTAGQWNIGVEGQITMGAILTTWAGRFFIDERGALTGGDPVAIVMFMVLAGIAGGVLWAVLASALKVFGQVHEIFGGLGLNFIATALTIYLMFGPWRQRTGGTLSGTVLLDEQLWLPTLGNLRVSLYSVAAAFVVVGLMYLALRGTVWGLQLKAVGRNLRGARTLGIPTHRLMFSAYAVCGACAGLAGAFLVVGVHHRLVPSISSGYGFLGILIVLLSGFQALWTIPIAVFFAAVSIGSTALQLDLQLDSSVGGVLQGAVVLAFLLVQGLRQIYFKGRG
jgi:simple sugar transport system permease protein